MRNALQPLGGHQPGHSIEAERLTLIEELLMHTRGSKNTVMIFMKVPHAPAQPLVLNRMLAYRSCKPGIEPAW
ncbi:hypothetical protein BA898_06035 [Spiribacter roseus]|nr:hypothetical protein BA898_06035 [Spiribacter roseus]